MAWKNCSLARQGTALRAFADVRGEGDGARHGRLRTLSAMLLLVSGPALAAPNQAGDDSDFGNSGLTTVPPVSGRGYNLDAGLTTLYDSNILRRGDGVAPRPGASKADFRFSPVVTGSIGLPVGRQQLFLGGQVGRDFYARNGQLNRDRYSIGGGVNLRAGTRCTGTLAADFASRQVLLSELAELVPNAQQTLSYGAQATCQAPVGIGFGGSVRRVERRNDNPRRELFDTDSTIFAPQISYALPVLGRFSLSGSLNQARYPRRLVAQEDGSIVRDGVDIMSGRFGYSRAVGSRINVALGVSYLRAAPKPGTILLVPETGPPPVVIERNVFSGLGYDATIDYNPGPRLSGSLIVSRNVTASPQVGAQYQIAQVYGVDLDYRLGAAITVGAGATYNQRDYRGGFASVTEEFVRISDKTTRVYGRVGFNPVKLYGLSLVVAHQDRQSNPDQFDFSSTSATLVLRVNFGRQS